MKATVMFFIFVSIYCVLVFTPVKSQGWHSKYPRTKKTFYVGSPQRMNWHSAYFHCTKNGSLLASAESKEDFEELADIIDNSDHPNEHYWLGGNDLTKEGHWVWSQGQDISGFTNWAFNEPSNQGGNENCLAMRDKDEGYFWNDWICGGELYFICQYGPAVKSDWPPAGAGEKKFHLELQMKADWHSAYMHCLRNNSRLARIENKEENDIVVAMIKQANLGFDIEYWLGAMDFPEVGQYFWLSTGILVRGYSNWHAGQGLANDQRCLTYWQSSQYNVKWNDFFCKTIYPFVCEYYD